MDEPAINKKTKTLHGKTIVITGASSGVGRAAAIEMASRGASVVLAARREEALQELATECEALGARALVAVTDVKEAAAVTHLAAEAKAWGGRIDVWINNAGVLAAGAFDETPLAVHEAIVQTNLLGYIKGAHAVLPLFKEQGYGVLINNISVGGWFPTPYAAGYSASKFGLRGFGEALQGELHSWPHIHVCNLYPAFLDTPGIQHAGNYTGKVLKPAPPVYNPQRVAKAMAHLVLHPKATTVVGPVSTLLRMVHALAPALSRRITAGVMETYFKGGDSIAFTDGNLFFPSQFGTSVHGGWNTPATQKQKVAFTALLIGGVAMGLGLLFKKAAR
ncbi:MAG TPA: SDR family oxidoreductase [Flavisolibacter sp.]|nr:SDR family oxidoreductase [Flavisolibacter sp.]